MKGKFGKYFGEQYLKKSASENNKSWINDVVMSSSLEWHMISKIMKLWDFLRIPSERKIYVKTLKNNFLRNKNHLKILIGSFIEWHLLLSYQIWFGKSENLKFSLGEKWVRGKIEFKKSTWRNKSYCIRYNTESFLWSSPLLTSIEFGNQKLMNFSPVLSHMRRKENLDSNFEKQYLEK